MAAETYEPALEACATAAATARSENQTKGLDEYRTITPDFSSVVRYFQLLCVIYEQNFSNWRRTLVPRFSIKMINFPSFNLNITEARGRICNINIDDVNYDAKLITSTPGQHGI